MKTSATRILTTHVGSMPRPESIRALLRARLGGQTVAESDLSARVAEAVTDAVRQQAHVGIDVVSDGEMSKASFLAYADERLTGFVTPDGNVWGRPVGITVAKDGSLLFSEDANNTIWRVSYAK